MNTKQLYETIKDRNAYQLFTTIRCQLRSLPPNGATNHKLRNLLEAFGLSLSAYKERAWPEQESFEQYQKRTGVESMLQAILISIEKFGVII